MKEEAFGFVFQQFLTDFSTWAGETHTSTRKTKIRNQAPAIGRLPLLL